MLRKLLIITCLLGTVLVAFGQKKKKKNEKEDTPVISATIDYKKIGSPLPPIRLVTGDGKVITQKEVANDANLFVMLFNPTCEHCQEETILLAKNIYLFKKTKALLMAAEGMKDYLEYFESATHVSEYPTLQMGLDSSKFIDKTFRYLDLPQINIYDKDRNLVRIFNGDTPLDSLKQYIE
jgi:hypothetical protein